MSFHTADTGLFGSSLARIILSIKSLTYTVLFGQYLNNYNCIALVELPKSGDSPLSISLFSMSTFSFPFPLSTSLLTPSPPLSISPLCSLHLTLFNPLSLSPIYPLPSLCFLLYFLLSIPLSLFPYLRHFPSFPIYPSFHLPFLYHPSFHLPFSRSPALSILPVSLSPCLSISPDFISPLSSNHVSPSFLAILPKRLL